MPTEEQIKDLIKRRTYNISKNKQQYVSLSHEELNSILCQRCFVSFQEKLGGKFFYVASKRRMDVKNKIDIIKKMMAKGKSKKEIMIELGITETNGLNYYLGKIRKSIERV